MPSPPVCKWTTVLVDSPVWYGPAEVDIHKEFSKAILSSLFIYANHPQEFSEGMVQSLFKKPHPDLDLPSIVKSALQTPTHSGMAMLISDIFGADRRPALSETRQACLDNCLGWFAASRCAKGNGGMHPRSEARRN
jgi:hypothetical protein